MVDVNQFLGRRPDPEGEVVWSLHQVIAARTSGPEPQTWSEAKASYAPVARLMKELTAAVSAVGSGVAAPALVVAAAELRESVPYTTATIRALANGWLAGLRSASRQQARARYVLAEPDPESDFSLVAATYSQCDELPVLKAWFDTAHHHKQRGAVRSLCLWRPKYSLVQSAQAAGYVYGSEWDSVRDSAERQARCIYACDRWATGMIPVTSAPLGANVLLTSPVTVDVSRPEVSQRFLTEYRLAVRVWAAMCDEKHTDARWGTFSAYVELYGALVVLGALNHIKDARDYPDAFMIPRVVGEMYRDSASSVGTTKVLERIDTVMGLEPGIDVIAVLKTAISTIGVIDEY